MKIKILVFIICFLLFSSIIFANVTEIYNEANNYFWNRDYINAIKNYKIIVNNYPTSSQADQALYSLGSAYFELQDYQNAIVAYKQLVEEYSSSNLADDALFRLGASYIKIADYKNANITFLKLIKEFPNSLLVDQAKQKLDSLPYAEDYIDKQKIIIRKEKIKIPKKPLKKIKRVRRFDKKYIVKPGDTLTSIAELFYNDFNKFTLIADYNKLSTASNIYPGMELLIPVETVEEKTIAEAAPEITDTVDKDYSEIDRELDKIQQFQPTTEEMTYKLMLGKQQKKYDEILKVERKKLKIAREKIKKLKDLLTKSNIDIETFKTQLNDFLKLKNDYKALQNKLKDSQKNIDDFKKEKIVMTSKAKADRAKLEIENTKLKKSLENLKDVSKEELLQKSIEEKAKEIIVLTYQLEKKDKEVKGLEDKIKKLDDKLALALETSELGKIKKEFIGQKKVNVRLKSDNIGLLETIRNKDSEIHSLNNEIEKIKKDNTIPMLEAKIEQKNAKINVLTKSINEYKLSLTKAEDLSNLKQVEEQKKFEMIQNQIELLKERLKQTEKSLVKQKVISKMEQDKLTQDITKTEKKLKKELEIETKEKEKIKMELEKKSGQLQKVAKKVIKAKEKVDKKKKALEHLKTGLDYKKKGQFEDAEFEYLKALELDPTNADAYNHLGYLYSERGIKLQEAIGYIQQAIDLNPVKKGYYLDSIGWIYYKLGDFNKALNSIKDSLNLVPGNDKNALAQIHFHLGQVYVKIGDSDKAFFEFFEVMKLVPNKPLSMQARNILDTL